MTLLLFLSGLVLLVGGAEVLVRGASRLAVAVGISPLVVGLTVVAYGTSAPELAVGIRSVLANPPQPDLAVGNVVGSNISNVLLVLGISAVAAPLVVARQIVRYTVPLMIFVSLLVSIVGSNGVIGRLEGSLLFLAALGYSALEMMLSRRAVKRSAADTTSGIAASGKAKPASGGVWKSLLSLAMVLAGLLLLVQGAEWMVGSATLFARWFGVSELVIGLTVVAVGTSLPEIATSLIAVLRGQRDIAVGNVVGSNIFNVLLVLGLTAAVAPGGLTVSASALRFDIPIMTATALLCVPVFFTGYVISRWEGALLLGYYASYTLFLVLRSTNHAALGGFINVMLFGVLPISLSVLVAAAVIQRIRKRPVAPGDNAPDN